MTGFSSVTSSLTRISIALSSLIDAASSSSSRVERISDGSSEARSAAETLSLRKSWGTAPSSPTEMKSYAERCSRSDEVTDEKRLLG